MCCWFFFFSRSFFRPAKKLMQHKLSRLQMGQRNIRKQGAGNATESHDQHRRILVTGSTEAVFGATPEASPHRFDACSFGKDVAVIFALGGGDWTEPPVAEAYLGGMRLPLCYNVPFVLQPRSSLQGLLSYFIFVPQVVRQPTKTFISWKQRGD